MRTASSNPNEVIAVGIRKEQHMEDLLTPEEVAEWFHTSTRSLANDRYLGKGPRFIKLGKLVRYARADVLEYLTANQYTRTDVRAAG